MNRSTLVAAAIVAVGALLALILTVAYILYAQPGRQPHAPYATESTAVRLVFQPAREQRYISSLSSGVTRYVRGVPRVTSLQARAFRVDGIHTLPYELALLVDQPADGAFPVLLYLNPLPESEGLLHELNRPQFFSLLHFSQWEGRQFVKESDEIYTAEGSLRAAGPPPARVPPTGPPELEGNHLFETVGDNRGGAVTALLESVTNAYGPIFPRGFYDAAWRLCEQLAVIRVVSNKRAADQLAVHFTVDGLPEADLDALLDQCRQATGNLQDYLEDRFDVRFVGNWESTGLRRAEGTFVLSGWETYLRRALGG